MLACATKPRERFDVAAGFQDGDLLHLATDLAGYPAGTALPVLGYLRCLDLDGTPYRLLGYVAARPGSDCGVPFARRSAEASPEAIQEEKWFGLIPFYLVEIEVTDNAHELALSRLTEPRVIPMYATPLAQKMARLAA